jgi:hypothetical protein
MSQLVCMLHVTYYLACQRACRRRPCPASFLAPRKFSISSPSYPAMKVRWTFGKVERGLKYQATLTHSYS